jgi:hypothetical protein
VGDYLLPIGERERGGEQVDRDIECILNTEAEWLLERLSLAYGKDGSEADRNYYQGRVDQLAQVRGVLGLPSLLIHL